MTHTTRRPRASEMSQSWGGAMTWGDAMKSYEHTKRHDIPMEFMGHESHVQRGAVAQRERAWNTTTQSFHDKAVDSKLRHLEKKVAVDHSNRATDVQILREQSYNIVTNRSRIAPIEAKLSPHAKDKRTAQDIPLNDCFVGRDHYNVVSNLGFDKHHWAPPGERPPGPAKSARARDLPAFMDNHREFNIVSNRYKEDHDLKTHRDTTLCKLEATAKFRKENAFDPLLGKYNDAPLEARQQRAEVAIIAEIEAKNFNQQPPAVVGGPSAYFDLVSNVPNARNNGEEMLKVIDHAERERTFRYGQRAIVDHENHLRTVHEDDRKDKRGLNRNHFDRHRTALTRGHDILTNHHFHGRGGRHPHMPHADVTKTPHEVAHHRADPHTETAKERADDLGHGCTNGQVQLHKTGRTVAGDIPQLPSAKGVPFEGSPLKKTSGPVNDAMRSHVPENAVAVDYGGSFTSTSGDYGKTWGASYGHDERGETLRSPGRVTIAEGYRDSCSPSRRTPRQTPRQTPMRHRSSGAGPAAAWGTPRRRRSEEVTGPPAPAIPGYSGGAVYSQTTAE